MWVLGSNSQGTDAFFRVRMPSALSTGGFLVLVARYEGSHAVRLVLGSGASHKGSNVREQVDTGF